MSNTKEKKDTTNYTLAKMGETIIYDDGEGNESPGIVTSCTDKGVIGAHVFMENRQRAKFVGSVKHYNQAKNDIHWKKG